MRVGLIQSNYIPWKGYFDIIHDVDLFIFYDSRQYTRNDWRNRNRIKTSEGTQWLSIPVGNVHRCNIDEVRLPTSWAEYHLHRLEKSYRRAPFYKHYQGYLRDLYLGRRWTTLSELNQGVIRAIARDLLDITSEFLNDDDFRGLTESKGARIAKMMQLVGATTYVTGPAARDYIEPAVFDEAGVELVWWDYSGYPEYGQVHPPFEHAVSILDLLFHVGPDAPAYIWGWRLNRQQLPKAS